MGSTTRREWIEWSAWQQASRSLRRRPAFLASAVLTLAFGTGITAAVVALVDTVLIKPLPYPDSDQLVTVYESSVSATQNIGLVAPVHLEDWHRMSQQLRRDPGSYAENVTDTSGTEPERLEGRRVQPRFFRVFATLPIAGRYFTDCRGSLRRPRRRNHQRGVLDTSV